MMSIPRALLAALTGSLCAASALAQEPEGLPLPRPATPGPGAALVAPPQQGRAVDAVRRFYEAFARSDFATMEAIYAPDVTWQDTVFSAANREELMGIWRLELAPEAEGQISWEIVSASEPDARGNSAVSVRWRDLYRFRGRPIDNRLQATLLVDREGRIIEHRESWSWSKWARQAFPELGGAVDFPPLRGALQVVLRRAVALKVARQERERAAAARGAGFVRQLDR